ncbi:DUF47 family protein [Candidatus Marsarchaeota archaeon]|nr:DUF47 family protein [Candidatus Marsarchaeota archaeon]
MGILDRILDGRSENQIMESGKRIIRHASAANKMLVKIIRGSDDLDGIRDIEQLADKEVFEAASAVTSGAIAPNLIDDMIRFLDMEDDIIDTMFNLARALVRSRGKDRTTDRYVNARLLELTELTNSALTLLYEMHKIERLSDARKYRIKIEGVEQRGDSIKDAMLDYAYSKKMDFKSFYYMQNVAYLADNILDRCEDTADMIVSIERSILT